MITITEQIAETGVIWYIAEYSRDGNRPYLTSTGSTAAKVFDDLMGRITDYLHPLKGAEALKPVPGMTESAYLYILLRAVENMRKAQRAYMDHRQNCLDGEECLRRNELGRKVGEAAEALDKVCAYEDKVKDDG